MAASNTRFTQNSLGQSKTPIDSDHGIYRDRGGESPQHRNTRAASRTHLAPKCTGGPHRVGVGHPRSARYCATSGASGHL
jgi:hypothetical protein